MPYTQAELLFYLDQKAKAAHEKRRALRDARELGVADVLGLRCRRRRRGGQQVAAFDHEHITKAAAVGVAGGVDAQREPRRRRALLAVSVASLSFSRAPGPSRAATDAKAPRASASASARRLMPEN